MDRGAAHAPGRDSAISLIRAASMCAIVLCHIFQYYGIELAWWFNVGVQVFFVMSGFLYGDREIADPIGFVVRRFKRILVPYYLYVIPVSALYFLFAPAEITARDLAGLLLCRRTVKGLGHLWFVGYILFCYLITPYLFWFRKKLEKRSLWSGVLLCGVMLAALQPVYILAGGHYEPAWISCYIAGYYLSYFIARHGRKVLRVSAGLFGGAALCLNGVRIWLKYFAPALLDAVPGWIFSYYETYAHAALGIGLFLVLYAALSERLAGGYLLRLTDRYSYYIYLVHHLYILGPFTLLALTPWPAVNCCAALGCALVTALLLRLVSERLAGEQRI